MSSAKDRVKLAIYKRLLEEEKIKNRRISMFSVAIFFVGIISISTYNNIDRTKHISKNQVAYNYSKEANELLKNIYEKENINKRHKTELSPDDLFVYSTQI